MFGLHCLLHCQSWTGTNDKNRVNIFTVSLCLCVSLGIYAFTCLGAELIKRKIFKCSLLSDPQRISFLENLWCRMALPTRFDIRPPDASVFSWIRDRGKKRVRMFLFRLRFSLPYANVIMFFFFTSEFPFSYLLFVNFHFSNHWMRQRRPGVLRLSVWKCKYLIQFLCVIFFVFFGFSCSEISVAV